MTLVLKNLSKIFDRNCNNLDGKLWVQKVILKKYLNKNYYLRKTAQKDTLNNAYTLIEKE